MGDKKKKRSRARAKKMWRKYSASVSDRAVAESMRDEIEYLWEVNNLFGPDQQFRVRRSGRGWCVQARVN